MKKTKLVRNIISGFGGQIIIIILGIIVPRIFIKSYGSDMNGLLATIGQVFSYMALLEAGIGQATKNALYKSFQQKDQRGIIEITSIARNYFKKFTLLYGAGVLVLSVILPIVLRTNVASRTIFLIVIFEGMSGVISFYFIQTISIVLVVDGKSYINNTINLCNKILGYIVKIIMAGLGCSIVFLQLIFFLVTVGKVFFYEKYYRKNYGWIHYDKNCRGKKLKDRNSYILTEICWTIFSSTDMIVLSAFVSTQLSSVYAIYNMVFSSVNTLLHAVYSSTDYLLGYTFHESLEEYEKIHDSFTSIYLGLMTVLVSVCYVLTIPFVQLYTDGISDISYIYKNLPIMFCLIQLFSWSRYVSGNLTGIAGYAKQTSYISLMEAILNVVLSIIFVRRFGIVGVLAATVVALPLKVIWCTFVADKKVMNRSYWKSISIIGINFIFFFTVVMGAYFFVPKINSYVKFVLWGVIYTVVFLVVGMGLNFVVNKECWKTIRKCLIKR